MLGYRPLSWAVFSNLSSSLLVFRKELSPAILGCLLQLVAIEHDGDLSSYRPLSWAVFSNAVS